MDQRRINRGSTWINVDQPSSACPFSLQPSACRRASCVRLMAHASHSRGMRPASCVPRFRRPTHVACVPLTWHASHSRGMRPASCVRLMAHASDSWLMRQASHSRGMRPASDSWLVRQASGVPRFRRQTHGSCVRRPTLQASHVHSVHSVHSAHSAPFSRRRCRS